MKIIGNAVGAPMPRTDYHQQDPTKSDYLVGREAIAQRVAEAVQAAQSAQSAASGTLPKTGGAMEGPIDMGGNALAGLPDPASDDEAASWGAVQGAVDAHAEEKDNPHDVTAAQTGAVEMKKLWENGSPNSDFAEQTIPLSLSGYQYVAIDYNPIGTYARKRTYCKPGEVCYLDAVGGSSSGGIAGAYVNTVVRLATVSDSGIEFTKAVYSKQNSTTVTWTDRANYAIPVRIFGIKGVT